MAHYLQALGIDKSRLTEVGYGEEQPVATNETATGRQQNRRVEVAIYADEALIEKAQTKEEDALLEVVESFIKRGTVSYI